MLTVEAKFPHVVRNCWAAQSFSVMSDDRQIAFQGNVGKFLIMKHFLKNAEGMHLATRPSCALFQKAKEMELMIKEQKETEMRERR